MRKFGYRKQASIQLENHHPGCMWGALHMLDYLAWRQVRKMLPYKRHGARRTDEENNRYTCQEQVTVQEEDAGKNERISERLSTKGSVRARLKSRIVEDILRRKGNKHHRSSTYPTRLQSDPTNGLIVDGKDNNHLSEQDVHASLTSDRHSPKAYALPPASYGEAKAQWVTFEDISAETDDQKELITSQNELIQETLDNAKEALLEQKLMAAKEHKGEAPLYQSKEFLDALDLVNLDKELLQGILREQDSSDRFQSQQHSFKIMTGSGMGGSSSIPEFGTTSPQKLEQNLDVELQFTSPKTVSREGAFVQETTGSPSLRNKEKSQVAIRHFKILRKRLRHAIKESKKEKHRITMDGVLHRIPYGHKLSADVKEITSFWKERASYKGKKYVSACSCGSSPIHPKGKINHFRRTSSMGDSMDKYCWLYESSFKKKSDQLSSSESSKEIKKEERTKKLLGRILSMPDLKNYYYIPNEYLNDTPASRLPIRTGLDGKSVLNRNISFAFEPLSKRLLSSASYSSAANDLANNVATELLKSKENIEADVVSNLGATKICKEGPNLDQDFEFNLQQSSANVVDIFASENDLLPMEDLQQQDAPEPEPADNYPREENFKDHKHLQVGSRDEVEFKYVQNVLDLAGLSRNHPHESWHANDQPVDPAVFDEVEGFEAGGDNYINLILFDLINEVLMDMYEKSFSYCPVPLSSLCRLRSMPMGDRVLSEVWSNISCYFSSEPVPDDSLDYVVGRDLAKSRGWMNLQFDTECVALELEDMIFDDLLDEAMLE